MKIQLKKLEDTDKFAKIFAKKIKQTGAFVCLYGDIGVGKTTFTKSVAKYIGAYTAAMNGVDAIVFTAGIGENDWETRAGICEYLGYLGVKLDEEAMKARGERVVMSTPDSKVKVLLIPTNEELAIARETKELVGC